jgi:hypothetical protein
MMGKVQMSWQADFRKVSFRNLETFELVEKLVIGACGLLGMDFDHFTFKHSLTQSFASRISKASFTMPI